MNEFNFQKDVLERSRNIPVLVDFWAEWCGPCKMLGPILDQLAEEYRGRFELVKVNTEEYPQIASAFQIRSIPNVKLFMDGKVADEFSGALPKSAIVKFLENNLPDKSGKEFDRLQEELSSKDPEQAVEKLDRFLEEHPDHERAFIQQQRYRCLAGMDLDEKRLLEVRMESEEYDFARYLLLINEFVKRDLTGDKKVDESLVSLKQAWQKGKTEHALKQLVQAVSIDKDAYEELPRRLGVAIFNVLGKENPQVVKYRKLFNMSLY